MAINICIDTLQRTKVDKFSSKCSNCSSEDVEIAVDTEFKHKKYSGHSNGSPIIVIRCTKCKAIEDIRINH